MLLIVIGAAVLAQGANRPADPYVARSAVTTTIGRP